MGYATGFTLITYSSIPLFLMWGESLWMRLASLLLIFFAIYLLAIIFHGNPIRSESYSPYRESLVHLLAFMSIATMLVMIPLLIFNGIKIDPQEIYLTAKPGFVETWNIYIPLYAILYWGISGALVAYFYHSVTFELFKIGGRWVGILAATTLFALNYNLPLISHYWNWWDIISYGFLFTYSYSLKRNPMALMTVYLLYEVPLWWCILAPFGGFALIIYFLGRTLISLIALSIFLWNSLGGYYTKISRNI